MRDGPMSDERLADLEMRWSVGRLTAEDVAELLREVRRLREERSGQKRMYRHDDPM